MSRAILGDIALEFQESGRGDPAILIHGALIADTFRPLLTEPSLVQRYRLITYRRRGYTGSSHLPGPVSIAQQAADCRALLDYLNVDRAHFVGHSYGGCVAIQLALETPDVAHSLALLEPALFVGATAQSYRDSLARGQQLFREGPAELVVEQFMQARCGAGFRSILEESLPGSFAQAVADAETSFELELPGLLDWNFSEEEARRITQPTLAVLGGDSSALSDRFWETHQALLTWFPNSEGVVIPQATHFLQMQNPRGMAEALADFWERHPIMAGA
jgi:pimeloyl-ACP methyl ester carboxylesterase